MTDFEYKPSRQARISTGINKTRISLFIHPDMLDFIDEEAQARRINRSEMLRILLEEGRDALMESSIV